MSIRIPINPEYDFDIAPSEQAEYANPVMLNNKLIQNANAHIAVSSMLNKLMQQLVGAKQDHREAETVKRDFEKQTIITGNPNSNDRKSTLLLEAFIQAETLSLGLVDDYLQIKKTEVETRNKLEVLQSKINANQQILGAIEASTVNIQTHLAYVKMEMRNAGNY